MEQQYLRAGPMLYGDCYPLARPTADATTWCAMQFDRPDLGEVCFNSCGGGLWTSTDAGKTFAHFGDRRSRVVSRFDLI